LGEFHLRNDQTGLRHPYDNESGVAP
jgi:hypothetical protein